jgi:hypothetical protein
MLRGFATTLFTIISVSLIGQKNWDKLDQTDGIVSNIIIDVIEETPTKWWIATDFGISLYENGQISNYPLIAQNPVTIRDLELAQGKIWMATDNGLYSFDGSNFEHFDTSNAFNTLDIPAIAVDSKDDLWIGTDQGVSVYDGSNFIRHDSINADYIYVDKNDLVYAFEFNVLVNLPGYNYVFDNNQWVNYGDLINDPIIGSGYIQDRISEEIYVMDYFDQNRGDGMLRLNYPNTPIFERLLFDVPFAGVGSTKMVKEDSLILAAREYQFGFTTDSVIKSTQLNFFSSTINELAISDNRIYVCSNSGLYYTKKSSLREIASDSLENNQVITKLVENSPSFGSFGSLNTGGFGFPRNNPIYTTYVADFVFVGKAVSTQSFVERSPSRWSILAGPVNNTFGTKRSYMVKIKKQEVLDHIANFNQSGYQMPSSVRNWPALGDSTIGIASDLAPFIDANNNGCYDPENGDYPYMKGDEAIYWITHIPSPDSSVLLEKHHMLYAYNNNQIPELNQCQFLQFRIVNRGWESFDSVKLGFYIDGDLGDPRDDYVGTDSINNIIYFYNGDSIDGSVSLPGFGFGSNPPAMGVKYLSDSMTNATYFSIGGGPTGDPNNASQWWNYLNSRWADGSPILYGGNGFNGPGTTSIPTTHMFTGDPLSGVGWSSLNPGGGEPPAPPGDRRMLASSPAFSMGPGESKMMEIVVGYGRKDSTANYLENVPEMIRVLNKAGDYWDSLATQNFIYGNNYSCPGAIGLTEQSIKNNQLKLYPNPAKDQLFIESELNLRAIQFYSMNGGLVKELQPNQSRLTLDLSDLDHGLYLIRLFDEGGKWSSHKLIVE